MDLIHRTPRGAALGLFDAGEPPHDLLRAVQSAEDTGSREAPAWLTEP